MNIITDKLDKITTDITTNVQTALIDKLDAFEAYILASFWNNLIDLILCLLLIDIYWCCFCLIMNRDTVSIPPFGNAKPMDNLFFLGCFYVVIRLVKTNHGF